MQTGLKTLLERNGISQRELARGLRKSDAAVSRLLSGDTAATQDTIEAVLAFLSKRLRRRLTYEQVFGPVAVSA